MYHLLTRPAHRYSPLNQPAQPQQPTAPTLPPSLSPDTSMASPHPAATGRPSAARLPSPELRVTAADPEAPPRPVSRSRSAKSSHSSLHGRAKTRHTRSRDSVGFPCSQLAGGCAGEKSTVLVLGTVFVVTVVLIQLYSLYVSAVRYRRGKGAELHTIVVDATQTRQNVSLGGMLIDLNTLKDVNTHHRPAHRSFWGAFGGEKGAEERDGEAIHMLSVNSTVEALHMDMIRVRVSPSALERVSEAPVDASDAEMDAFVARLYRESPELDALLAVGRAFIKERPLSSSEKPTHGKARNETHLTNLTSITGSSSSSSSNSTQDDLPVSSPPPPLYKRQVLGVLINAIPRNYIHLAAGFTLGDPLPPQCGVDPYLHNGTAKWQFLDTSLFQHSAFSFQPRPGASVALSSGEGRSDEVRAQADRMRPSWYPWLGGGPVPDEQGRRNALLKCLKRDAIPDLSKLYVSLLKYLRDRGFPIESVEVAYKPDLWSLHIPPASLALLLKHIALQLYDRRLDRVKLYGPGTSLLNHSAPYFAALQADESAYNTLAGWSVQAWDDVLAAPYTLARLQAHTNAHTDSSDKHPASIGSSRHGSNGSGLEGLWRWATEKGRRLLLRRGHNGSHGASTTSVSHDWVTTFDSSVFLRQQLAAFHQHLMALKVPLKTSAHQPFAAARLYAHAHGTKEEHTDKEKEKEKRRHPLPLYVSEFGVGTTYLGGRKFQHTPADCYTTPHSPTEHASVTSSSRYYGVMLTAYLLTFVNYGASAGLYWTLNDSPAFLSCWGLIDRAGNHSIPYQALHNVLGRVPPFAMALSLEHVSPPTMARRRIHHLRKHTATTATTNDTHTERRIHHTSMHHTGGALFSRPAADIHDGLSIVALLSQTKDKMVIAAANTGPTPAVRRVYLQGLAAVSDQHYAIGGPTLCVRGGA
ncbi:unnamed protein product [Vitrella brassicaformis CCMP3155]|uniref:Uncharacterized protein n=3 Tax=Vitrella brassicaformis TaxID=1169539 RepID=A0A0G4GLZ0_VITBC|nr:unnamed protein product [Vitrella brassicaformis CCMP3155]|eukprot:CEM31144.1 unnamed protein product [Vitrella brassicaformis CCMP3155]